MYLTSSARQICIKIISVYYAGTMDEQNCKIKSAYIYAIGYVVERNLGGLTSKLVCFLGRNVVFCGSSNKAFFFSVWFKVWYFRQLIWYEIRMQDDHESTFQTNLRLLSFSPALDGKDKPSNTTTGITPAFFTEIWHFWKISPHLGN